MLKDHVRDNNVADEIECKLHHPELLLYFSLFVMILYDTATTGFSQCHIEGVLIRRLKQLASIIWHSSFMFLTQFSDSQHSSLIK